MDNFRVCVKGDEREGVTGSLFDVYLSCLTYSKLEIKGSPSCYRDVNNYSVAHFL